ncbi:MAG: heparinase II/III-family protein [Turicibacter sp.]|nr:heparinase II/III-family protein [Turicibacter sp.]
MVDNSENTEKFKLKSKDMANVLPHRRFLKRAAKLIAGKLALDNIFKEEMEYSINDFDWNVVFSKSATTHQLYIQGLRPVGDLAGAFDYYRDKKYFDLAMDFVKSWHAFSKSPKSLSNEYVWDHHCSGLRAENILYFVLVGAEHDCFSKKDMEWLRNLLIYHGEFLEKTKNYLENHNHGVYQDRALLYLAETFGRADWTEIACTRLKKQWDFLFNSEMVCVENSYTYQRINVDLFKAIAFLCERQDISWGKELLGNLSTAQDFMGYATMPNGFCAPFGDTFMGDYSGYKAVSADGVMTYAASKGENGVMPNARSAAYPDAGYYFGREHWQKENFQNAVWTMFRSGYKTITHRQADDNSFMFYARDCYIFVDSGLYTYNFRDPIRMYTRSANSHNTVIADEISFRHQRTDCTSLCGIVHSDIALDQGYDYVVGYNSLYFGIFHLRHFVFLENAVFIFDEIESEHEHNFSQLFHCGKDTSVESANPTELRLRLNGSDEVCVVKQLELPDNVEVINGADENAKYGICSDSFEEYFYINTAKFNKRSKAGKKTCFATAITLEDKNRQISFDFADRTLYFVDNGNKNSKKAIQLKKFNKYKIVPNQAFVMDSYTIEQEGSKFSFINMAEYKQPVEYAYYIVSKKTRKPTKKEMYSKSPAYIFDFAALEYGEYSIRAFVQEPSSKRKMSQVICHITCENGQYSWRRELDFDAEWATSEIERDVIYG